MIPIRKVRSRAPLRLGLAGGGTDVSPYCDQFGGSVMNATIDLYAYCTIERIDTQEVILESSDRGQEVRYPLAARLPIDGTLDLAKGVYNRIVRDFHRGEPIALRIVTCSDAPAGSGLGSSSTLVVSVVQAFTELLGLPLGEYDVAHLAFEIERLDLGLNGGRQDQYAATFGGFNFMEFFANDRVIVNPLRMKDWVVSELEASLVLFFTGVSRDSAGIIDQQAQHVAQRNERSIEAMHRIKAESVATKESLLRGDLAGFVESLRQGWESKKAMASKISNELIDQVDACARGAGAYAGKVSGAGGGGFMFFFAPPEKRIALARALDAIGLGNTINCHFVFNGAQAWRIA